MVLVVRVMAKPLSAPQILRIAAGISAIPASAEINARQRSALWRRGELEVLCQVTKEQGHILTWSTFIGDAKLGPAMTDFGSLSIKIRGLTDYVTEWPIRPSAELETFLQENLGKSSEFIVDREDLCELLASYDDVARGRFYAWLTRGSYPARLVQALIVAHDMGSSRHISMIKEKLNGGPIVLSSGDRIEILPKARYWAKEYEKALGAKIDLDGSLSLEGDGNG